MSPTPKHQIDAYLRDELNPGELKEFESYMDKDPSFAQEVQFEQNIAKGLSEVRKAELKARLDAIDVSPVSWVGGLGQLANNAVVKTIGGIAAASVIGVLIYNSNAPEDQLNQNGPLISSEMNRPSQEGVATEVWENLTIERTAEQLYSDQSESESFEALPSKPEVEHIAEVTEEVNDAEKEFTPQVNVPQPGDLAKEEGLSTPDSNLPDVTSSDEIVKNEPVAVDVKTINRKNESLKYKYFDGKLFLYGDFNQNPYEILEINGVKERKLYLHFEEKYFKIDVTDKVSELNELNDNRLIKELDIIRNNKL